MNTRCKSSDYDELMEKLARIRLGYSCWHPHIWTLRTIVGDTEHPDDLEPDNQSTDLFPWAVQSTDSSHKNMYQDSYCIDTTAARMLGVTLDQFRRMCVMPDNVLKKDRWRTLKPLYLRSKIEKIKAGGNIFRTDAA